MSEQAIKAFQQLQEKGLLTAEQDYAPFLAGFKAARDALGAQLREAENLADQWAEKNAALCKEAEALRAENAALRAKQGERQEAVVYAVHAKGAQVDHHCPLVSPDMAADYLPGCATPLYTTPQPAPAQDVAGLASSDPVAKADFETRLRKEFESRWPKPKGVTWGAGINDYCVSEFAEGIALSYPDMWMAYKAGAMRTNQ